MATFHFSMFIYIFTPPMKGLFFILSWLILFITCIPCADSQECTIKIEASVSGTNSHDQHSHALETCSPFCTCSCCAVSACSISAFRSQLGEVILENEKHALYDVSFKSVVGYSIFQPPKVDLTNSLGFVA